MHSPSESSTNLLVRFLDQSIDDEALHTFFSQFGHILTSMVQRDIHNGHSRGFGFVRFSAHAEARAALENGNGALLGTKHINVLWAKKQHDDVPVGEERLNMNKLFVRNVPTKITAATLSRVFCMFGAVSGVSIHQDTTAPSRPNHTSARRHIAFIMFEEVGAAERALKKMHNTVPFQCCNGIPLMCKLSENYQHKEHHRSSVTARPTVPRLEPSDLAAQENTNNNSAHLNVTHICTPGRVTENVGGRPSLNWTPDHHLASFSKSLPSSCHGHHERSCSVTSSASADEHIDYVGAYIPSLATMPCGVEASHYQPSQVSRFSAATAHPVVPLCRPTQLHYRSLVRRHRNPASLFALPMSPRLESSSLPVEDLYMSPCTTPRSSAWYTHNPYSISCLDE